MEDTGERDVEAACHARMDGHSQGRKARHALSTTSQAAPKCLILLHPAALQQSGSPAPQLPCLPRSPYGWGSIAAARQPSSARNSRAGCPFWDKCRGRTGPSSSFQKDGTLAAALSAGQRSAFSRRTVHGGYDSAGYWDIYAVDRHSVHDGLSSMLMLDETRSWKQISSPPAPQKIRVVRSPSPSPILPHWTSTTWRIQPAMASMP
jgi:hypothetical protein